MKIKTTKPGKQRKFRFTAPQHVRRKFLTVRLHPSLQVKYGIKRIPVRVGDTVLVTRGAFRDIEGKVNEVDYTKIRVRIDNVTSEKTDGSQYYRPITPGNLIITKIKSDKKRSLEAIEEGE